jgi:hypothetical protein
MPVESRFVDGAERHDKITYKILPILPMSNTTNISIDESGVWSLESSLPQMLRPGDEKEDRDSRMTIYFHRSWVAQNEMTIYLENNTNLPIPYRAGTGVSPYAIIFVTGERPDAIQE